MSRAAARRGGPMRSRSRRVLWISLVVMVTTLVAPSMIAGQDDDDPATTLRVTMARLLAEHAMLSLEVVRSAIAATPDLEAGQAMLERNTNEVIAAIEGVFGREAGAAFAEQWRNHIGYLVDYARARIEGDADAAELASAQLDRYVAEFSALLAEAMPALPRETVTELIHSHVQQLEHVAAFDEGDFGHAYPAIRETYRHMFDIGDGLVVGIVTAFPSRFAGREHAFSPATDLRMSLDRLLGEHTYLAALAMRATLNGDPDARSAADALNENAAELAALIEEIYGAAAGDAFADLWTSHVGSYFAYVEALAEEDQAAAETALAGLTHYRHDFSGFVADANPLVTQAVFASLIEAHSDHLVRQADAYAAGDYEAAYQLARDAYDHSGELSASLAGAIGDQFPRLFPDTAMDPRPTAFLVAIGIGLALAGLAAGVVVARRRRGPVAGASISE
jgi:hypothetical protein